MRRTWLALPCLLSLALLAPPAGAAPVATTATLGVTIQGLAPITLVGAGTVSVTGSTLYVPAGLVSQVGSLTIPVCSTTAVSSIIATGIANLSGTFSVGGVTAQAPGEVCGTGPVAGQACNVGGGLGGVMALTGVIAVHVIPHVVVIPVNLNAALLGQGGSTNAPFTIDAAPWTTGTGLVNTGTGTFAVQGSFGGPLTLVTPTFVVALGNLLPIFSFLQIGGIPLPVPEPALAALLVGGLALFWGAGRRRSQAS